MYAGDEGPQVATGAGQWSTLAGNWSANTSLLGSGYPGLGYASIQSDGSGYVNAGRFQVARVQFSALQDGIAVGTCTTVRNNVDPTTNAITSVTDVQSASCAFVVFDDGSVVLTSNIFGGNWRFTR
jgi:hypothetical protein